MRLVRAIVSLLMVVASSAAAPAAERVKIVLAGDSTVTDDVGWGKGFANVLKESADCVNLSKKGRSSKSFRDEGWWQKVLDEKPNFVIIQFGHNDQPGKGPTRETNPATTYRENLARYIDEAKAIGAQPILVTSIARRQWGEDGQIHSTLVPYVEAVKAVAKEKDVPVIDLHARSIEVYLSLGQKGCELISPVDKDGKIDGTHFNERGSATFGSLMGFEVRESVAGLKQHVRGYKPATRPATTPATATRPSFDLVMQGAGPASSKGKREIVVAQDASGEFKTIQEAIAAVADNNADRTVIRIKEGLYQGQIIVPASKQNVTFAGAGSDKTIITYALNVIDPMPESVPQRLNGDGVVVLGDGFRAEHLTMRNRSGDHGQAMALRVDADQCEFVDCRLDGWQDTLLVWKGRQYFKDCYIAGRVDFIYGGATAVFDHCEIHSKDGGHITAASTPQDQPLGFVFLNCKVTGYGAPADLGRPWRPYGSVTWINCWMGEHIKPEGWNNWGKEENEKTARYAEYGSTGPGANPDKRFSWAKKLTKDEAEAITAEKVLGWNPTAE